MDSTHDSAPHSEKKKPRRVRPPRPNQEQLEAMVQADVLGPYELAAFVLGIPIGTIRSMVANKQIPHHRLGPRTPRFRASELRAWIESRKVVPLRQQSRGARNTRAAGERRRATAR